MKSIAFNWQAGASDDPSPQIEHTPPLRRKQGMAVAFAQNQRDEVRTMDVAGALASKPGMKQQTYVAGAFSAGNSKDSRGIGYTEEGTPPLRAGASGTNQVPTIHAAMQVRRLTPRECERLQGFPDDYTLIPHRGKEAADGPRYKALGNSMAVPCMRWIGERIGMVDRLTDKATGGHP